MADEGGISLDYQLLVGDQILGESWPQFSDDLYNTPSNTLAVLSLAIHEVPIADINFP